MLKIRATNFHLHTDAVVPIEILDFNDSPPTFTESNYTIFVQVSEDDIFSYFFLSYRTHI